MRYRTSLTAIVVPAAVALGAPAHAQPTAPAADAPPAVQAATLTGQVIDARTGEPIAGATIQVDGEAGVAPATSDEAGAFSLAAGVGATLVVEADGYQLALIGVESTDALTIGLEKADAVGELIEISDRAPPAAAPGAAKLYREELATLPGTGGDILASLDILPGVTTPPGGFGGGQGVIIRGSSPEDSRILLDGFDIPQLYHLFGRSIIPTEAVAGLDYLPGAFDVRYGRASSGIVSITSRGGEDQLDGAAEVSIIDAGVVGSGPVGDKARVLASFRRSYVDSWLPSVLPDTIGLVAAPRFYDGLLRVDGDLATNWSGAVTVVGSDDATELVGDDDQSDDDFSFRIGTRFVRAIAAATWRGNHGGSFDAGLSGLAQDVSFEFGNGSDQQFLTTTQLSLAGRAEFSQREDDVAGLRDVLWRVGGEVDPRRFNVQLSLDRGPDEGQPVDDRDPVRIGYSNIVWLTDLAAWTSFEGDLSPKLRLQAGLRVDAYARNEAVPVHPRGELRYTPDDRTTLRLAAGRYTRPAEFQEELLTPSLQPESSTQIVLGGERKIGAHGNVQVSLYDSERTDLITRGPTGDLINQGRGRSFGAELLATYRGEQLFGWLSTTVSRSTRRDTPTSPSRLFDYDQTVDLVAAATYKTKSGKWQFGGKFTFKSGQPYTPILGAIYDADENTYYRINGEVNSERLGSHHQLDVRIDRIWSFDGWKLSAFLDVQNVYLNPETISYQYNYDYSEQANIEGLPIVPSIGLRGEL